MWKRIEGEIQMDCEGGYRTCTNTNVKWVANPYMADVGNEIYMEWLCDTCYDESCMDI
jgi:hypothetical protein